MKPTLQKAAILAGLMAFSALAQEFKSDSIPSSPPDKKKLSYALGMNLALQLKKSGTEIDADTIAQAIKDVMAGNPTLIQPSEINLLFMQARDYEESQKAKKFKLPGEAFQAKNAKEPGVTVLPDGLQYHVLKTGAGAVPDNTNIVTLKYRGTWIDGTEFRHLDRLTLPMFGCPKAWREALLQMKVGSKWQLVVPSALAYGDREGRSAGFGSTLIYELELTAIAPPGTPTENYIGGRMGHSPDEEFLPDSLPAK